MIIDIHTHYGVVKDKFNMPLDMLLCSMDKYGIDYSLISNITCGYMQGETDGNAEILGLVRKNSKRLGAMLWCAPGNGSDIAELERQYLDNRDIVKGLKIHPDISGIRADDKAFEPYLKTAEKYGLPVLFHTQDSPFSKVIYVINAAKRHPNVSFILGHMSLCSDNTEAISAIKENENVYGDTSWVKLSSVKAAAEANIGNKLMFGTDSPIGGPDTYGDGEYYTDYYDCNDEFLSGVMCENARRIFKL